MKKDVFTAGEAAVICRTSRQTMNRWLNDGELKGYRPTKKSDWRITRKELVKFMKKNEFPLEFINEDKIKILVIDDDKNFTSALVRAMSDEERFLFEVAYSGFSAGTKITDFEPDVVILDIFLGDMDGREFFKHIREQPELNGIKVIGISGKLAQDEIKPLLDRGFNAFFQKPLEMEKLKETILKVIED